MQEEINQQISRLIDGELGFNDTLDLLKKIQSDEILKHKMCRYQAISEALKADVFYQVSPDFSHKIFQKIQSEPAYLLPNLLRQPDSPNPYNSSQPNRHRWYALVASITIVAVLVGQSLRNEPTVNKEQTVTAMAVPQQSLPINTEAQPSKVTQQDKQKPLSTQFNDYLQAHNSSVYTNGEANFQPYAKVTSYNRD